MGSSRRNTMRPFEAAGRALMWALITALAMLLPVMVLETLLAPDGVEESERSRNYIPAAPRSIHQTLGPPGASL